MLLGRKPQTTIIQYYCMFCMILCVIYCSAVVCCVYVYVVIVMGLRVLLDSTLYRLASWVVSMHGKGLES